MHDLETIKRLNCNPSKRSDRDNPAPQPTRAQSRAFYYEARAAVHSRRYGAQSPAMNREPLDE